MTATAASSQRLVRAASLSELREAGRLVARVDRHTICLFADGDDVHVDVTPREDPVEHQRARLRDGLERDIPLVLAKAAITLWEADRSGVELFREALDFGVERRGGGW